MTDLALPPQPLPDPDTRGFWEATARGELAICRCSSCGLWLQPPLERCRRCASATTFEPVSGAGSVYSYIVVHHPAVPGFLDDLPYVVALVELDEQPGLRLAARIMDTSPDAIGVGQRVQADLVALRGSDFHVPVFRLA
jgi:uncharacterized protein